MGDDVRHPARGLGLSSLCLQEKKGVQLQCVCILHVYVYVSCVCVSLPPNVSKTVLSFSSGQCGQCCGGSHLGPVQFIPHYSSEGQSLPDSQLKGAGS